MFIFLTMGSGDYKHLANTVSSYATCMKLAHPTPLVLGHNIYGLTALARSSEKRYCSTQIQVADLICILLTMGSGD
jgi:hypothetical protein